MRPVLITPPAALPVSLAEIKAHCRIEGFEDDDVIAEAYATAAVSYLDGYAGVLGRAMMRQTWSVGFDDWCDRLRLPFCDVSAVTVAYIPPPGSKVQVSSSDFLLGEDSRSAFVDFRDSFEAPSLSDEVAFPVRVEATVGWATAADVPWALKAAVLLLAGHLYANREATGDVTELPFGVKTLIAPFRRIVL